MLGRQLHLFPHVPESTAKIIPKKSALPPDCEGHSNRSMQMASKLQKIISMMYSDWSI
jgi:hypothetical protein